MLFFLRFKTFVLFFQKFNHHHPQFVLKCAHFAHQKNKTPARSKCSSHSPSRTQTELKGKLENKDFSLYCMSEVYVSVDLRIFFLSFYFFLV